MLLNNEEIQAFKKLYEEEFDEPISEQEAGIMASRLITLYEALARPLPNELAQFTDPFGGARLNSGVGVNEADKPPASEKVVH